MADQAGVDIVLVGDSLGMCVYGYKGTVPVTMDQCIVHSDEVAGYIARTLTIPVFSIGAGKECDGQLLIVSDLIGQFQAFTPKFVKKYCDVASIITNAMKEYCADVKEGKFPEEQHCYNMIKGEKDKFLAHMKK